MRVLLSIKPEFAFKIFEGTKKYEFRKVIFKRPNIKTVVVYASSPVQKVIGEFEIEDILSSTPDEIWKETQKKSGITKEFFKAYFSEKETAYAIKIRNVKRYEEELDLKEEFNLLPPQSFAYL